MAPPIKIDWERIEPDWRAGCKSIQQIKTDYETDSGEKVSKSAINKHFKELGVPRDLSAKVQDKARAIVSASIVSGIVSTVTTIPDAQIINVNAVALANIQIAHRKDIQRSRALVMCLLEEVEQTTTNHDLFKKLGELMYKPDEKGQDKLNEIYQKVISMSQRIDGSKKLSEALKTLVTLERQAFKMDADLSSNDKDPLTQLLESIAANRVCLVKE